jgi:hypothetical protein
MLKSKSSLWECNEEATLVTEYVKPAKESQHERGRIRRIMVVGSYAE